MPTALGPFFAQRLLPLLGHDVERLVPRHRRELAVLVVFAVLHAQERRRQPVLAVHDLRKEVAFHAVHAAVHFRLRVAVGRDDLAFLDRDAHAAARAAEAARRLRPAQLRRFGIGDDVGCGGRECCSAGGGANAAAVCFMNSRRVTSLPIPISSCSAYAPPSPRHRGERKRTPRLYESVTRSFIAAAVKIHMSVPCSMRDAKAHAPTRVTVREGEARDMQFRKTRTPRPGYSE